MSYTKTVWQDRAVETPNTYTKSGETSTEVTLVPKPGTVTQAGTPATATLMNKLEQGVYDAHDPNIQLTNIKTVDGAGSGLDADLLDGLQGTDFVKKDGTVSMTSDLSAAMANFHVKNTNAGSGLILSAPSATQMVVNCTFDGTNWNRTDTSQPAYRARLGTASGQLEFYSVASGANPITWSSPFKFWNESNDFDIVKKGSTYITTQSWDTFLEPGMYQVIEATWHSSAPPASYKYGTLYVMNASGNGISNTQMYIAHTGEFWVRGGWNDGSWNAWRGIGGVKNVQRGSTGVTRNPNVSTTVTNVTISSVDMAKSFITVSFGAYINTTSRWVRARLSSSTNLEITLYHENSAIPADTNSVVSWEVVENY